MPSGRDGAGPGDGSSFVGDDVCRQLDGRAVLPETLERVELALLLVLDVDDDVSEVDQHPTAVTPTLAADRLGAHLTQPVLDLVHDRLPLAVVGGGGEAERVGGGRSEEHTSELQSLMRLS